MYLRSFILLCSHRISFGIFDDFHLLTAALFLSYCQPQWNDVLSNGAFHSAYYVSTKILSLYLAHVIKQPNFQIPNPQYLQQNFCFDFFNDSENTF